MIDSLATPAGILLVLALLVGGCISAGISVYTASVKLQQDHEVFRDRQAKNGYVAMSDVQRLILTAQEAFRQGGLEGDLRAEFSDDADIIYVRIDNFERMTQQQEALPSGTAAIAALRDVLQIADAAVASDDVDVDRLLADLIRSSAIARHHLVQFLDDMRRNADAVLDSQSDALLQQRAIVIDFTKIVQKD